MNEFKLTKLPPYKLDPDAPVDDSFPYGTQGAYVDKDPPWRGVPHLASHKDEYPVLFTKAAVVSLDPNTGDQGALYPNLQFVCDNHGTAFVEEATTKGFATQGYLIRPPKALLFRNSEYDVSGAIASGLKGLGLGDQGVLVALCCQPSGLFGFGLPTESSSNYKDPTGSTSSLLTTAPEKYQGGKVLLVAGPRVLAFSELPGLGSPDTTRITHEKTQWQNAYDRWIQVKKLVYHFDAGSTHAAVDDTYASLLESTCAGLADFGVEYLGTIGKYSASAVLALVTPKITEFFQE